ncbi:MAG: hypothetical protein HQ475_11850 [SAR202 cluster bacterium]|nr:hypothetical protein [SAR202 cluster bacterium]
MNKKGFYLLMVTVVALGGSIGGAFSGGLALGRTQGNDAVPESAVLRPFGQGQSLTGGASSGELPGGRLGGSTGDNQVFRFEGEHQTRQETPSGSGGPSGFGSGETFSRNILTGIIGSVDGNLLTVTTDSGETQVNLAEDATVQLYESGTSADLSPGDQVLVFAASSAEGSEVLDATSVIVNPPEGAGLFGGGRPGGR